MPTPAHYPHNFQATLYVTFGYLCQRRLQTDLGQIKGEEFVPPLTTAWEGWQEHFVVPDDTKQLVEGVEQDGTGAAQP